MIDHPLSSDRESRLDIYTGIHKAQRAMMANALLALGRADYADDAAFKRTLQMIQDLLEFSASHLLYENKWIHPAIEACAPGSSMSVGQEHAEHDQKITDMSIVVRLIRDTGPDGRALVARELYRELALFIGANFQHMHIEETVHNAVLWAHYSDAELAELQERLVADIPPREKLFHARWMIPFMNPAERAAQMTKIRQTAPAAAFLAVLQTVKPHLSCDEWQHLHDQLHLSEAT